MRKISGFAFWVLLGLAVVIVPIACSSSSTNNDARRRWILRPAI